MVKSDDATVLVNADVFWSTFTATWLLAGFYRIRGERTGHLDRTEVGSVDIL